MVGTHSHCLSEWEKSIGDVVGFFFLQKVKIVLTFRCPRKDEITFFYSKTATLGWDSDWWWWVDDSHFLNYTTKLGKDVVINMIPMSQRW